MLARPHHRARARRCVCVPAHRAVACLPACLNSQQHEPAWSCPPACRAARLCATRCGPWCPAWTPRWPTGGTCTTRSMCTSEPPRQRSDLILLQGPPQPAPSRTGRGCERQLANRLQEGLQVVLLSILHRQRSGVPKVRMPHKVGDGGFACAVCCRTYRVGDPMPDMDPVLFNATNELAFWLETAKMRSGLTGASNRAHAGTHAALQTHAGCGGRPLEAGRGEGLIAWPLRGCMHAWGPCTKMVL